MTIEESIAMALESPISGSIALAAALLAAVEEVDPDNPDAWPELVDFLERLQELTEQAETIIRG